MQSPCGYSWLDLASLSGRQYKVVKCEHSVGTHFNSSALQTLEFGWNMSTIEEIPLSVKHMTDLPSIDMLVSQSQKIRKSKNFACSMHLHTWIVQCGVEAHEALGNHLVPLFVDCGSMPIAQQIFHRLVIRNEYTWASLIQGYLESGKTQYAFDLFQKMQEENASPSLHTYVSLLKACAKLRSLTKGQEIHTEVAKEELENNPFVSNILLDLYAKCGSFDEARDIFEMIPIQSVLSWTAIISGYTEHGLNEEAFICWEEMQQKGILPDPVTFVCVLKTCAGMKALHRGQEIHSMVVEEGLENNVYVGNALLGLYAKCGFLLDAQEVFEDLPVQDVVSWTELIIGYSEYGSCERALNCLEHMQAKGVLADAVTYIPGIKACGSSGAVDKGQELHAQVIKYGWESQPSVGCSVVDMYVNCSLLLDARKVFDKLPAQNKFSWTVLILGYVEHDLHNEALTCLQQMRLEGVCPDAVTLVCGIRASNSLRSLEIGRALHSEVVQEGFEGDPFIGSSLVGFYAECGLLVEAREVFNELLARDLAVWNALMAGYVQHGLGEDAMNLLSEMQHEGVSLDALTYASCLKACSIAGDLSKGLELHSAIVKGLCELDFFVASALVEMYAKHGLFAEAKQVFNNFPEQDIVLWSILIARYADLGLGDEALSYFEEMQLKGISPNAVTYLGGLKACCGIEAITRGKQLHADIVKKGFEDVSSISNALVTLYASCGWLTDAQDVFNNLSARDGVSWASLLAGYAKHQRLEEASNCLELLQRDGMPVDELSWSTIILSYAERGESERASITYARMQEQGISPSSGTFLSILKAHGNAAALEMGRRVHAQVHRNTELQSYQLITTALVSMYGKCGSMVDAHLAFSEMLKRDIVGWNALVTEYARKGDSERVFHSFDKMQQEGIQPDQITFLNLLTVCNHAGLADVGCVYFQLMSNCYGIIPTSEHHNCLIDLLSRAGQFDEAIMIMDKLPSRPDLVAWSAVLSSCQNSGNVETAGEAFEMILSSKTIDASTFTLMSNIYADAFW